MGVGAASFLPGLRFTEVPCPKKYILESFVKFMWITHVERTTVYRRGNTSLLNPTLWMCQSTGRGGEVKPSFEWSTERKRWHFTTKCEWARKSVEWDAKTGDANHILRELQFTEEATLLSSAPPLGFVREHGGGGGKTLC